MKYVFDPPPNIPYPYERELPHDEAKRLLAGLTARFLTGLQPEPAATDPERAMRFYFREFLHMSHGVRGPVKAARNENVEYFVAAVRAVDDIGGLDALRSLSSDNVMEARAMFVEKALSHLPQVPVAATPEPSKPHDWRSENSEGGNLFERT